MGSGQEGDPGAWPRMKMMQQHLQQKLYAKLSSMQQSSGPERHRNHRESPAGTQEVDQQLKKLSSDGSKALSAEPRRRACDPQSVRGRNGTKQNERVRREH